MHVDQWEAYSAESSSIDTIEALTAIDRWLEKNNKTILTASTAIMIAPGFRWRMVNVMVTNFHQPQSTLLLLVSSFLEREMGFLYGATFTMRLYATITVSYLTAMPVCSLPRQWLKG